MHGSICSFHQKIIFQNVRKKFKKNERVHLDILHAHAKFHDKPTFFVSSVKRQKKMSCAKAFFGTEFCVFIHNIENIVFLWNNFMST
jgi:hypothetical protein